jgi:ligand-binding sensor domain-containing protein
MTRFAAAVVLLLYACPAAAQQYRIDAWTADDGLPQNSVNQVVQTRDGFIWLATFAGLARYDGARFEVFNSGTTPQLHASRFTHLIEDRDGNLWAATEGQGVVRYAGGIFHSYGRDDGLIDLSPTALLDDGGRLIVDSPRGAVEWRGGRFVPAAYTPAPVGVSTPDFHENVIRQFPDREGRVWIEYDVGGSRRLAMLKNGTVTRYTAADGVPSFATMKLFEDRDGNVWLALANKGGLLRFTGAGFRRYTTADGLPDDSIGELFQDREGSIWLPTEGGLARLSPRPMTAYSTADGLAVDNTYAVYQDRAGTVWIGGWSGITQYKQGVFRALPSSPDLYLATGVTSFLEDRDGDLWIGSWGGGVARLRSGTPDGRGANMQAGGIVRAI